MSVRIELSEEAWKDAAGAIKWYDEQKDALGDIFIAELQHLFQKITEQPAAYKKVYLQVRQARMAKFPYIILYKIVDEKIIVHGIFHTKRNPQKRLRRLKK